MSANIVPQTEPTRNPSIALIPIESLGANEIPSLIHVAGQFIHAPIIQGDTILVDTGVQIIEFSPTEVHVLRIVLASLANAPEVVS